MSTNGDTQTMTFTGSTQVRYEMKKYEDMLTCDKCPRRFKTEQGRNRHLKDYHRIK